MLLPNLKTSMKCKFCLYYSEYLNMLFLLNDTTGQFSSLVLAHEYDFGDGEWYTSPHQCGNTIRDLKKNEDIIILDIWHEPIFENPIFQDFLTREWYAFLP